ncbi:alpha/beta hydrolase [Priestia aryabhattai]
MRKEKKKGNKVGMFILLCVGAFIVSFIGSAIFKTTYISPELKKYSVDWNDEIGSTYTDITYGDGEANKFDLYVPANNTKETYGLVVYLHAGGFTTGDKSDDARMLQWLASKGYVAAGINYTLRDEEHPKASVYSQSMEIKSSIPAIVEEAKKLGYNLDSMAISGGSAGGTLAMLYAYRDADESPIPVKMLFEAVGPSSFYPEDWSVYGLDQNPEAAANLFSIMSGTDVTEDMFGTEAYEEAIKPISAYKWVNENSVPTVAAYGVYDKVCPFDTVKHLVNALEENNVPHEYIELPHSGHALQNDNNLYAKYMKAVEEYLDKYMPTTE